MSAIPRPKRPVLAFTLGDSAGIGPEVVLKSLRRDSLSRLSRPLLIGEKAAWLRAGWRPGLAALLDTGLGLPLPAYGKPSRASGQASFAAVRLAVRLAQRSLVDGIVTAPISKRAWALAGAGFEDHTEFLRGQTGRPAEMILAAPERGLWCVLATRHVPLRRVAGALSRDGVLSAARALDEALRRLGLKRPRLGLCALNPHAGEEGLLGGEEKRVLAPAVAAARRLRIRLEGPVAADTAWRLHGEGRFDGLVALYHDQALIPLKAAAGLSGVNWTAGLPFVRTSPAHGTAFDIAGSGRADASATLAAAHLALRLLKNR